MESTLGYRISQLQDDLGYSNREFSSAVGVRENLMSEYKYDAKTPPLKTIIKICRIFDVDANWLILGKEDEEE